jgi:hypothetical protein
VNERAVDKDAGNIDNFGMGFPCCYWIFGYFYYNMDNPIFILKII